MIEQLRPSFGASSDRAAETYLRNPSLREFLPALKELKRMPDKVSKISVSAYINHARWVVSCPTCNSAQLTSPSDKRFFCVECCNVEFGGLWLQVEWPKDPDGLSRALSTRPRAANRNWSPGETVEDLIAEKRLHHAADKSRRRT